MRSGLRTGSMLAGLALGLGLAATAAQADGYPPFYGYSEYFGAPRTYFTPDDTIGETTTETNGQYGFGKRTYYRGGPFWEYGYNLRRPAYVSRARGRRVARRHR